MKNIGFIGIGIMGKSMVKNLIKRGYAVTIHARNEEKARDLIAEGAVFSPTIRGAVEKAEAVITIVGFPRDVEEVYFGKGAILDSARRGLFLIDMTTTSPKLAKRISEEGAKKGCRVLDAPVTGGDAGARDGTLSILVGGDPEDCRDCLPIFEAMGSNINHFGPAGSGQHAKLANQIMIAGALSGVCEGLSYAMKQNLPLETFIKAVATGAAGSSQLNAFGSKLIDEDYSPGFFMKHMIKDLKLAMEEASDVGLDPAVGKIALENYEYLESLGFGELGTHALIKRYNS
ncbi:MAG: NAD(P)-dependent oxidoreductase [Clostridiales Family XIII bacterium]|jgi:3-hydroxyisobutyrate dehydrogenase/2-hydroxy-3-oxopropionate reductase|nr:NAD(P)-dependent oxidoreductase [Clostridiales Family XIII bacterium]